MNELVRVSSESTVEVTPELLAKAFWGMDSKQQARFFVALYGEIQVTYRDPKTKFPGCIGETGDGQWYYLGKDLEECENGKRVLMSMAAPHYWHTLQSTGYAGL